MHLATAAANSDGGQKGPCGEMNRSGWTEKDFGDLAAATGNERRHTIDHEHGALRLFHFAVLTCAAKAMPITLGVDNRESMRGSDALRSFARNAQLSGRQEEETA